MVYRKFCLVLSLCLISFHQSFAQLSTDYSITDAAGILGRLVVLTGGQLLAPNSGVGPVEEEVKFFCYNRQTDQYLQTFVNDPNLSSKIDATKPIYFVTHGWFSSVNQNWARALKQEMAIHLDANICFVSWDRLANYEYFAAANNFVPLVADYLTELVIQVKNLGIALADITLVGHSLGGQISGRVGRNIFLRLGIKIGRIFGLDPANPLFCLPTIVDENDRLDKTDADFVQVIHSSDGLLGCAIDQGHQDFRPDGGINLQTACFAPLFKQTVGSDPLICHHYQSVLYFLYSVNPANVFTGRICQNYLSFLLGDCDNAVTDILGPWTQGIPGKFYLRTSASAPFTPIPPTGNVIVDNTAPFLSVLLTLLKGVLDLFKSYLGILF